MTSAASEDAPAPTSPRRRRIKHRDSFAVFERAPNDGRDETRKATLHEEQEDEEDEPLWRKAIITPLAFISFVLSLLVVERRDRQRRASEHPTASRSFWTTFGLQNWLDPEPYQDPSDTTWRDVDGAPGDVPQPARRRWFISKKHRKVSKVWLDDALEMRGTMVALLLVAGCVLFGSSAWLLSKLYGMIRSR